jgi:hypothetical protein
VRAPAAPPPTHERGGERRREKRRRLIRGRRGGGDWEGGERGEGRGLGSEERGQIGLPLFDLDSLTSGRHATWRHRAYNTAASVRRSHMHLAPAVIDPFGEETGDKKATTSNG